MLYIIIGILVLILDIISKHWALGALAAGEGIPLIPGVFHLTYVENTGIAFGMMENKRIVFITLSVIILAALFIYLLKAPRRDVWLKLGTALVISGSLGNLIERVSKGYVVDFLDFRLINFPVFNVADIAVCVGAAALVIHFLFGGGAEKPQKPESEADIDNGY